MRVRCAGVNALHLYRWHTQIYINQVGERVLGLNLYRIEFWNFVAAVELFPFLFSFDSGFQYCCMGNISMVSGFVFPFKRNKWKKPKSVECLQFKIFIHSNTPKQKKSRRLLYRWVYISLLFFIFIPKIQQQQQQRKSATVITNTIYV